MTKPAFHSTWTRLQGLDRRRDWVTYGEILASVKAAGIDARPGTVRRILRALPQPTKAYGMFLYTPDHRAAVIQALSPAAHEVDHVRS